MPRSIDDIKDEIERRLEEPVRHDSDHPKNKGNSLASLLLAALLGGGAGAGGGVAAANVVWADQAIRERLELPRVQAEQIKALEERVRRLEQEP